MTDLQLMLIMLSKSNLSKSNTDFSKRTSEGTTKTITVTISNDIEINFSPEGEFKYFHNLKR